MAMIGLDPQVVEGAANALSNESANLNSIIGRVDLLVNSANRSWQGADARSFVQAWQGCQRSQMKTAANTIVLMSDQLKKNVAEQQQASAAGGSGSGNYAGGGGGASGGSSSSGGASGGGGSNGDFSEMVSGFLGSLAGVIGQKGFSSYLGFLGFADKALGQGVHDVSDAFGVVGSGMSVIGTVADWAEHAGAGKFFGVAGSVVSAVSDGISVYDDIKKGDYANAAYDIAHGVATVAIGVVTVTCPPVGIALGLGLAAVDLFKSAYETNPAVKQFCDGVDKALGNPGKAVVEASAAVVKTTVQVVDTTVKTVANVAKSGWDWVCGVFGGKKK